MPSSIARTRRNGSLTRTRLCGDQIRAGAFHLLPFGTLYTQIISSTLVTKHSIYPVCIYLLHVTLNYHTTFCFHFVSFLLMISVTHSTCGVLWYYLGSYFAVRPGNSFHNVSVPQHWRKKTRRKYFGFVITKIRKLHGSGFETSAYIYSKIKIPKCCYVSFSESTFVFCVAVHV